MLLSPFFLCLIDSGRGVQNITFFPGITAGEKSGRKGLLKRLLPA